MQYWVNIRVAELQPPLFDERPVPEPGLIEKLMYLAFLGQPPSEAHDPGKIRIA